MAKMIDRAGSVLHIPQDVAAGEPVITVTGRRKVYIENYKRIISFLDDEVKLQGKTCRIIVRGKRLVIEYYTEDDILISGLIYSVATES
ncbi:MAG: sporulation protein [Hungatella sp.]|nr:sporulation protein [Hungatella sp.]